MPGPLELIVILVIALVIFGPKRLPELGGSLGKGIREFRSSVSGKNDEGRGELNQASPGSTETVDGEIVQDKHA